MVTEQYKDAIYFSSLFAWHYPNVYKEISDILVYHHIEQVHYYTLKIIGVEIICQYSGDLSLIFNFAMNLII